MPGTFARNHSSLMLAAVVAIAAACGGRSPLGEAVGDAPSAIVSTTALTFEGECGGPAPAQQTITISNAAGAGAQLDWTASLTDASEFGILGAASGKLAPGASADITVAATAVPSATTAGQTTSGALVVTTNDPGHAAVAVPLELTARGATFEIVPSTIDFGQMSVDASPPDRPVTVQNVGNETALASFDAPDDGAFAMHWTGDPTPAAVAPGAELAKAAAHFHPTLPGEVQASASLHVEGAVCGGPPPPLFLRGEGVNGVVGVSPGKLDFGLVPCGSKGPAQSVVVFNTGNASFQFWASLGKGPTSPYVLGTATGTVAPQGTSVIAVTPKAMPTQSAVTPNLYGDTLTIMTSSIGDPAHVIPLSQTAAGGILTISPSPLAFGKRSVGATTTLPLTFTNTGNVAVTVSLSTTSPFSTYGGASVPANDTIDLDVGYTPDATKLGIAQSAIVTASSTDTMCQPFFGSVKLSGTAIDTATDVAVGSYHVCALGSSGNLYCWGGNFDGQLGDGTTNARYTPELSPEYGVTGVVAGGYTTCALLNGGAQCWGDNFSGQLGNYTTIQSLYPTGVFGLMSPTKLSGGAGNRFCALEATGGVQCWGSDATGAFGAGDNNAPVTSAAAAFGGLTNAIDVATNATASCVAVTGGTVLCAGQNTYGQLGDGTNTDSNTPVSVSGLSSAVAVTTAWGASCARLASGSVACWGEGSAGELGNGSNASSSTPVLVFGLNDVTQISGGQKHVCAVRSGGSVVCWGDNYWGELGDGTTTSSNVPVTVSNLTNATKVSASESKTCAIHDQGRVSCWGTAPLGDGTGYASHVPLAVLGFN